MKTKYLLILIISLIFYSCNDCKDMLWDFTNYEFIISVSNKAGENLFDPEVKGNLLDGGVQISYKNKIYDIVQINVPETRYLPPEPLALRHYPKGHVHGLLLGFGEFGPEEKFKNEKFKIIWADGTIDEVKFDCYIDWKDRCNPEIVKNLYLNGERVSKGKYDKLTFVK